MSKVLISEDKLSTLANKIREKSGVSGELTLSQMGTSVTNIQTEIPTEVEIRQTTRTVSENNESGNGIVSLLYSGPICVKVHTFCAGLSNAFALSRFNKITFASNSSTASVSKASRMFAGASGTKEIDMSNITFTNSGITSLGSMFLYCNSLEYVDITNTFNYSNITDFGGMFQHCSKLKEIKGINVSMSKATNFSNMFQYCYVLTSLDLSNWCPTNGAISMNNMFYYCNNLTFLDLRSFPFDTASFSGLSNTFLNANTDCLVVVKDDACKQRFQSLFSNMTNVKTVAEYEESELNNGGE